MRSIFHGGADTLEDTMDAQAGLQPHKIQLLQECFLVNFGNAVRTDILENFIWHLYSGTDAYKVPGKQLPVQTQH